MKSLGDRKKRTWKSEAAECLPTGLLSDKDVQRSIVRNDADSLKIWGHWEEWEGALLCSWQRQCTQEPSSGPVHMHMSEGMKQEELEGELLVCSFEPRITDLWRESLQACSAAADGNRHPRKLGGEMGSSSCTPCKGAIFGCTELPCNKCNKSHVWFVLQPLAGLNTKATTPLCPGIKSRTAVWGMWSQRSELLLY